MTLQATAATLITVAPHRALPPLPTTAVPPQLALPQQAPATALNQALPTRLREAAALPAVLDLTTSRAALMALVD